jgi:hypothetical protein
MPPTKAPASLQVFDPVLSNLARRYKPQGFIARQLLPSIPVSTLSGQYPVFPREWWYRVQVADNRTSDRAPAKEIDFEWSTDKYFCEEYGLKTSITDLERAQAIPQLKLEQQKTELLTHQMEFAHEVRVSKLLLPTSLGGELDDTMKANTSVANWDTATGDAEKDFKIGSLAMYRAIGQRPTHTIIPFEVAYALAVNPVFRALLRYDATGKAQDFITVGDRVLPSVIHGMNVIIPEGAQMDTANEGAADQNPLTEIWGKHVRLLRLNPGAGWGQPSVAYVMAHTAKRVTRWSQVDPDIDYVREQERYDLKVVAPQCGYTITNVIT